MIRTRARWLVAGGLPVLVMSVAVVLTVGPADISVGDVTEVVRARLGLGTTDVSRIAQGIVWELRLPRALLAAICGAGLGVCGAVLQSLLRNPLADPYLLGISSGASTGAVVVAVLGAGAGAIGLAVGAFAGALVAFALVMALAALAGGGTSRVILAGVAGSQLFSALTSYIVMTSADAQQTQGVLFWLLGSLSGARWDDVALAGAVCALGLLLCQSQAGALDAFAFGHDSAASLGVAVQRVRGLLLAGTALVTATLVASSGAIGFVGLVLPQAARFLVGTRHRALLPATAVLGAILLVWVDSLAGAVAAPQEVPVGVITALVGVPAFAFLLVRKRGMS
ncbi:iron chelate uptake ABC transporter family permease subunit [Saccharopolyspora erythraea]|uniref:FecCD family ABC transporter permease n=1 Tax=Saccharopolyspora erythraea TaxID=1836 RepID=UPI001BEFA333|nr:iron chelate uptake ABC transporter family permease subunit [Saccharopolyspora erythraea]QUH02299.1 iron chelate uptake ABC transporter family permease subunit [Saccharopolyspora erythraea]